MTTSTVTTWTCKTCGFEGDKPADHPRCEACKILIGEGHAETRLATLRATVTRPVPPTAKKRSTQRKVLDVCENCWALHKKRGFLVVGWAKQD